MGNIQSKKREELSENSSSIVDSVSTRFCEGNNPVTIFVDATITEMAEAMKYVVDSGMCGSSIFYARKIQAPEECNSVPAVLFTDDETDFDYGVEGDYFTLLKEYPTVVGYVKHGLDSKYDGDVFIKLQDGSMWQQKTPQRTRTHGKYNERN